MAQVHRFLQGLTPAFRPAQILRTKAGRPEGEKEKKSTTHIPGTSPDPQKVHKRGTSRAKSISATETSNIPECMKKAHAEKMKSSS